jgi:predicted RNase H-like nuclease (RuvC/YqgF family)
MEIQQNEKDKKSKTYLAILIGALLILNIGIGVNLYMSNRKKNELAAKVDTITSQNTQLTTELQAAENEIKSLQEANQGLEGKLTERDEAIAQKITQIKILLSKGKLSASELQKAKSEIAALRNQIEDYKSQIEQLTQKNAELTTANDGLNQTLTAEQMKTAEQARTIDSKNRTIGIAKKLNAGSIIAMGVRERKMFGKKELETNKANKVEEIKVRFSIDKNEIADAGEKDIFIKIIGPDGAPIATKVQTTKVDGTETLYTEMKTVDYKNEKSEQVVYCKKQGAYRVGEYTVEIFAEGYRIGTTKFSLK